MDAPLALYRRYRPETFTEVIGQEHVTDPLCQALRNNRVNHAYLFSGPRGCGKTTSARILARCLNCEQGPTPEPCGACQSCTDLARGGPGSIDVIEIDAASHGGVDDARDLRERAFFAPVASRYKIYIVDEAHMVTPQGFNALLKLVEEPPEHLKFVFATTEPDKVIGTIRSRTHHYPFRLVPPKLLQDYLGQLCEREAVAAEPAVLPLVVRSGGGSVRDTLSVLDQLIGGAGPDGVTYHHAAALLGHTPDGLLDTVVDGLAASDGAEVFGTIDKVIESGQDPKRFGEDLLRRLRDLIVVANVPDAGSHGLLDGPAEQAERLASQAARFGRAELSRAAEVVSTGLTEMRGATAPRLQLELICARALLPAVDDSEQGLHARVDRVERRLAISGGTPTAAAPPPTAAPVAAPTATDPSSSPTPAPAAPQAEEPPAEPSAAERSAPTHLAAEVQPPEPALESAPESGTASAQTESAPQGATRPPTAPPERREPIATSPSGASNGSQGAGPSGGVSLHDVRQLWPNVLERVKSARRFTWIMLSQNAQVVDIQGGTLVVALVNQGARDSFTRSGSDDILRQALLDEIGVDWRVEAIVDGGAAPRAGTDAGPSTRRAAQAPQAQPTSPAEPSAPPTEHPAPPRAAPAPGPDSAPPNPAAGDQPPPWEVAEPPAPPTAPAGGSMDVSAPAEPEEPSDSFEGSAAARAWAEAPTAPAEENVDGPVEWPQPTSLGGPAEPAPTATGGPLASGPDGPESPPPSGPAADWGANPSAGLSEGSGSAEPDHQPPPPEPYGGDESFEDDPYGVDPDGDAPAPDAPTSQADLLARELGAQIIEERDDPTR